MSRQWLYLADNAIISAELCYDLITWPCPWISGRPNTLGSSAWIRETAAGDSLVYCENHVLTFSFVLNQRVHVWWCLALWMLKMGNTNWVNKAVWLTVRDRENNVPNPPKINTSSKLRVGKHIAEIACDLIVLSLKQRGTIIGAGNVW